jgi:glycerate-2-kinase
MTHSVLRDHVNAILRAALSAVDPASAVRAHARRAGSLLHFSDGYSRDLNDVDRVVLLSLGMAAVPMARSIWPMIAD